MAERTYSDEKNSIRNFYHSRYASVVSDTKQVLGLSGTLCTLTVENDTEQGTVRINTVIPESGTWKGQYFSDYPVMLHAEPADGKQLAYWETSDGRKLYGSSAELSLSGDMTVTAVYEQAEIRKGDVNADGVFNTADLILLQKWLLAVPDARLADWETADFNADGKLTIFDFCLMKRALLHQN
ncbi:MAG: dockerin type I repeat-containing protein [Oscillospiraceae bacterium]|nr:dockerin type I repeat-containing protein [Oscillospiraceae bacterium]